MADIPFAIFLAAVMTLLLRPLQEAAGWRGDIRSSRPALDKRVYGLPEGRGLTAYSRVLRVLAIARLGPKELRRRIKH